MIRRHHLTDSTAAIVVLGYGFLAHRLLPQRFEVPVSVIAAGGVLALARAHGISPNELGIDRADIARGAAFGAAVAAPIVAGILASTRSPTGQRALRDQRIGDATRGEAAYHLTLRIPIATVALEEIVFRGTLLARYRRHHPVVVAVLASSLVFGVWHLFPALEAYEAQQLHHVSLLQEPAGAVLATVGATALAGTGLAALRLRSRSLLAPIIVHAAANAAGYFATRRVTAS